MFLLTASPHFAISSQINLSGGQKQRVNLARAVYSNSDIVLLDDPLSAVDSHVGQHLFTECIRGILRHKTIIFVTHQLQYLSLVDRVYVLDQGSIQQSGTYSQIAATGFDFASLIQVVLLSLRLLFLYSAVLMAAGE